MQNREESDVGLILAIAMLGLGMPLLYQVIAGPINTFLLYLAAYEIRIFTLFSAEAKEAYYRIMNAVPYAKDLTFSQILQVTSYVGGYIRWPFLIIVSLMAVVAFSLSRIRKLRRRLNMKKLLKNNVEIFPCLKPVIGKGDYLLSPESYDQGPWKVARTPLQFSVEAGLLKDAVTGEIISPQDVLDEKGLADVESPKLGKCILDSAKAYEVFTLQLGPQFSDTDGLTDIRKAVLAALLTHGAGAKLEAIALLYEIAGTYKDNRNSPTVVVPIDWVNTLLKRHSGLLAKEKTLTWHSTYELPLLMSVLNFARKKGVLACSQFLWVRPLDRPLWYALNQMGGKAAWAEALAPWSHFYSEEKFSRTISVPFLDGAFEGLRVALDAEGWLYPEETVLKTTDEDKHALETMDVPDLAQDLKDHLKVTNPDTGIEHKIYSSYD